MAQILRPLPRNERPRRNCWRQALAQPSPWGVNQSRKISPYPALPPQILPFKLKTEKFPRIHVCSTVGQGIKLPFISTASHTAPVPAEPLPIQQPANVPGEEQKLVQILRPSDPRGRHEWSLGFITSVWSSPGLCSQLGERTSKLNSSSPLIKCKKKFF